MVHGSSQHMAYARTQYTMDPLQSTLLAAGSILVLPTTPCS